MTLAITTRPTRPRVRPYAPVKTGAAPNITQTKPIPYLPTQTESPDMLEWALAYAQAGIPVFPVDSVNKKPLIKDYLKNASTNREVISKWWTRWAHAGIGCVPARANLVAIDLDGEEGIEALNDWIAKHGPAFTETVKARSGREGWGEHLFFSTGGRYISASNGKVAPGVDVRGVGGYLVLPPSLHQSGRRYTWLASFGPHERPPLCLPDWLAEKLMQAEGRSRVPSTGRSDANRRQSQKSLIMPNLLQERKAALQRIAECARTEGGLVGEYLTDASRDQDFIRAACRLMGIPDVPFGKTFLCVLPGHEENGPSASIYPGQNGVYVYRDFHVRPDASPALLMSEVAYALALRRPRSPEEVRPSKSGSVTWHLRLMVETGYVQPARVQLPALPYELDEADTRIVYDKLNLLFQARWLHTYGDPAPLSWQFLEAWCALPQKRCQEAMKNLLLKRIVAYARDASGKQLDVAAGRGRRTKLFLPGNYRQYAPMDSPYRV